MKRVRIQSYKHNGTKHRAWESAWLIGETPLRLHIPANTPVENPDGSQWESPYDVEAYFADIHWYNVFTLNKQTGIEWYCNVASPPRWNPSTGDLEFVDYDLDIYVYSDGSFKVLDREEYEAHAQSMNYPKDVQLQAKWGLSQLIHAIRSKTGPFGESGK